MIGASRLMRIIDLLHRWTGGVIGIVLALLGLSGAILVHRRSWVMLPHAGDAPVQTTAHLAATTAKLMADPAAQPRVITFADPGFGLDRLTFKDDAGAYADQAGTIVTHWSSQWERPELWLFDLHHHLATGDVGETIAGIAGLCGIAFVVTGAILWWRTRKTFAFRLLPRRLSRPAIVRHHRDLGIVMMPLLLLSFVTGSLLVFRPLTAIAFGPGAPTAIAGMLAAPKPAKPKPAPGAKPAIDWAAMIVEARARFPQAELRSVSLPRGKKGLIAVRMKQPEEWVPGGRTTLWFSADTGRLIGARDARDLPRQAKAYNMLLPLHAAEVGGLAYRLVMTLSGLTLALLGTLTVWSFWFKGGRRQPQPRKRAVPI